MKFTPPATNPTTAPTVVQRGLVPCQRSMNHPTAINPSIPPTNSIPIPLIRHSAVVLPSWFE